MPRSYRQLISLSPPAAVDFDRHSGVQPWLLPGTNDSQRDRPSVSQAGVHCAGGGSRDETPTILNRDRHRLHRAVSVPTEGKPTRSIWGSPMRRERSWHTSTPTTCCCPDAFITSPGYFQNHPDVDVVYGHRVFVDSTDLEIGRWVLPRHDRSILAWADYVPQETMFWRRRIWNRIGAISTNLQFRHGLGRAASFSRMRREDGAASSLSRRISRARPTKITSPIGEHRRTGDDSTADTMPRPQARSEIRRAILGYLLRHSLYDRLYWCKILSY